MSGPQPRPIEERFWEKVSSIKRGECWPWAGKRNNAGYGLLAVGSRTDGSRRFVIASRLSYEINVGPIPDGMDICHRCDNPPCVNPAHLFPGTRSDNVQDALRKGRLRQPDPDRTHCRHGHELTPENTKMQGHLRLCRQCGRDASRRHYAANAESERARARVLYQRRK